MAYRTPTSTGTSGPLQLSQAAKNKGQDQTLLPSYPMTGQKRGFCLIINNYDFSLSPGEMKNREGTHMDEERLHDVFTWLGFTVEVVKDCTRNRMLSSMRNLAKRNHSGLDCVACCVLSHGREGGVCGVDGEEVSLKELTNPLSGSECASLVGKPKLFFIQACRGEKLQQPVYLEDDISGGATSTPVQRASIPSIADLLIAMSTVPSFGSLRNESKGSWFIQSLCQHIEQMVPRRLDLVGILTMVNDDVSQKIASQSSTDWKQMPELASCLRKGVVFPVPPPKLPTMQ